MCVCGGGGLGFFLEGWGFLFQKIGEGVCFAILLVFLFKCGYVSVVVVVI